MLTFDTQPEGVYIFVKLSAASSFPEFDYLQDSMKHAIDFCVHDLGIPKDIVQKYITENKS